MNLRNASRLPWLLDTNMLVYNMVANVLLVIPLESMAREQIVNVAWTAERTQAENVELDGETVCSNFQKENLRNMNPSLVNNQKGASKIQAREIYLKVSTLMTLRNASRLPWLLDTNMLVYNMVANVLLVMKLASMVKDQIENATWTAEKTQAENVELDGETVCSNCQKVNLRNMNPSLVNNHMGASKMHTREI